MRIDYEDRNLEIMVILSDYMRFLASTAFIPETLFISQVIFLL